MAARVDLKWRPELNLNGGAWVKITAVSGFHGSECGCHGGPWSQIVSKVIEMELPVLKWRRVVEMGGL